MSLFVVTHVSLPQSMETKYGVQVNSHCTLRSDRVCSGGLHQDKRTSGVLLQSPNRLPVVLPCVTIKDVKSKGGISRDWGWTGTGLTATCLQMRLFSGYRCTMKRLTCTGEHSFKIQIKHLLENVRTNTRWSLLQPAKLNDSWL